METTGLRISVLITTRNRAQKLHRLLRSIANQTHVPNEVIVVDNASSDNTSDICIKMNTALNIKYIHETRVGIPYGRNTGISQATGDIFAFIDDDCEADAQWIENILNHFLQNKHPIGIIGRTVLFHNGNIYTMVEYTNYSRWVYSNLICRFDDSQLHSGIMVDSRFFSFPTRCISKYVFPTQAPFGGRGDEDIER